MRTIDLLRHVVQLVGRPFRFARIARIVRYFDGLSKVTVTIMSALPVTLQARTTGTLRAHPRPSSLSKC